MLIIILSISVLLFVFSACEPNVVASNYESTNSLQETAATVSIGNSGQLSDHLFMGGGEGALVAGGDNMYWYTSVFSWSYGLIPMYAIDIVGMDVFVKWAEQFSEQRTYSQDVWRQANLRTLIEDFGITMQELIEAKEAYYGMSMREIDALINHGRDAQRSDEIHENMEAYFWSLRHSTSDMEALFSNDVSKIWAAFPGYGVFHDGRAYSPEWILNNMHRAINDEAIPLEEIVRILDIAFEHHELAETASSGSVILQAEMAARR